MIKNNHFFKQTWCLRKIEQILIAISLCSCSGLKEKMTLEKILSQGESSIYNKISAENEQVATNEISASVNHVKQFLLTQDSYDISEEELAKQPTFLKLQNQFDKIRIFNYQPGFNGGMSNTQSWIFIQYINPEGEISLETVADGAEGAYYQDSLMKDNHLLIFLNNSINSGELAIGGWVYSGDLVNKSLIQEYSNKKIIVKNMDNANINPSLTFTNVTPNYDSTTADRELHFMKEGDDHFNINGFSFIYTEEDQLFHINS